MKFVFFISYVVVYAIFDYDQYVVHQRLDIFYFTCSSLVSVLNFFLILILVLVSVIAPAFEKDKVLKPVLFILTLGISHKKFF